MRSLDLTPRMRAMLLESEPDDINGNEGAGVELKSGGDYAVAKALKRRGIGTYEQGEELPGLYFNNEDGLALRRELRGDVDPDEEDQDDD